MFFHVGMSLILLGFFVVWYMDRPKPPPPPPPPKRVLTEEELELEGALSYVAQLEEQVEQARNRKALHRYTMERCASNHAETIAALRRKVEYLDKQERFLCERIDKAFYRGSRELYRLHRLTNCGINLTKGDIYKYITAYIEEFEQRIEDAKADPQSGLDDTWARGRWGISEAVLERVPGYIVF